MKKFNKKNKIIFIESTFLSSGPNNQLKNIIKNLKNFSYKLLVLSDHNHNLKLSNKHTLNIPKGMRGIFFLKKISNFLNKNDYDLIHLNSSFRALFFINLIVKNKSRIIFVLRNDPTKVWIDKFPFYISYLFEKVYIYLIKKMNIVFCSYTLSKKYKKLIKNKNCVIQNSINLLKKKRKLKKINEKKIKFLVLSRLIKTKNIEFLIKSFKENEFFSNHELYIAGDGNMKKKLKKISLGTKNIFFKGYISNITNLFEKIDILLSASITEGLPNSALEAMSHNIPCILSNIPQHKEIFYKTDYLRNLIFKNNDVNDLIKCTRYFLNNKKEVRLETSKVIKNFSVKKMSKKYENFYELICSN